MNAEFEVGDLIRSRDDSNANTIYRVLKAVHDPKAQRWEQWQLIIVPVFGLFKSDYRLKKKTSGNGYQKLTLLDLAQARNRFDIFIQGEAKRLSGEK